MAKFSDRQRKKVRSGESKGNINYALGCLFAVALIPILTFGVVAFNRNEKATERRERVKTQYEEGLQGSMSRRWVFKGHEFSAEEKNFSYKIAITNESIPKELDIQYRKKDANEFLGSMTKQEDGTYAVILNTDSFEPGTLELEAVATSPEVVGKKWTSEPVGINLTFPLYVVWTMDWEGMDVSQSQLDQMSRISTDHKNLPLTHFFNPRAWSGGLSSYQANLQINYVKQRAAEFGDGIGLHTHMWYDVPRAAGVTARTSPAWNSENNISGGGGYDVPASAYPYEEFLQIVNWSKQKFEENGLGTPISYRAGGWYLDLENVKALQDAGYKIDSSGRDARFWGRGYIASPWSLGSTTQPYKISTENLNSDYPAPRYDVWEMPNNAADSYWFSAYDMITAVNDNFQGRPLRERRISVILSHPHWFSVDYPKLQELYKDLDTKHYYDDNGPILYTTLEKYYEVLESDPNSKYLE